MQRKHAEIFLNKVLNVIEAESDPTLIKKLLIELKLDTFKTTHTNLKDFLEKIQQEKIDLNALLLNLKTSLLDNEPLQQLFAFIQHNHLIEEEELKAAIPTFKIQLNLIVIFEALLVTAGNSKQVAEEIFSYILKQRNIYCSGNTIANFLFGTPFNTSIFKRLKMISIDPAMAGIAFHKSTGDHEETKEDTDTFIKKHNLSGLNANLTVAGKDLFEYNAIPGMTANILEAAWEEATHNEDSKGTEDNKIAAMGLIGLMENKQYTSEIVVEPVLPNGIKQNKYDLLPGLILSNYPTKKITFNIDLEWKDLYTSWNAFFIISHIDAYFLPLKLILPSVISAKVENFVEMRVISLFLLGNLTINLQLENNPFISKCFKLKNSDRLFAEWGKINKNYADNLFKNLIIGYDKTPSKLFDECFGQYTTINFIKNIANYLWDKDFHATSYANTKIKNNHMTFFASSNHSAAKNAVNPSNSHYSSRYGVASQGS